MSSLRLTLPTLCVLPSRFQAGVGALFVAAKQLCGEQERGPAVPATCLIPPYQPDPDSLLC